MNCCWKFSGLIKILHMHDWTQEKPSYCFGSNCWIPSEVTLLLRAEVEHREIDKHREELVISLFCNWVGCSVYSSSSKNTRITMTRRLCYEGITLENGFWRGFHPKNLEVCANCKASLCHRLYRVMEINEPDVIVEVYQSSSHDQSPFPAGDVSR